MKALDLALIARCATYSLALGFSFLLLTTVLSGFPTALIFYFARGDDGPGVAALIFVAGFLSVITALIGLFGGAIAGFFSPPRASLLPFQSSFFRRVLRSGIGGFAWGVLAGIMSAALIQVLTNWGTIAFLLATLCGQIYGIGRGLSQARRAALALPRQSL